jgi:hypothetical protein
MKPEKQHPDSVNRDLDDEVAQAIEHQYAGKLIKPAGKADDASVKADEEAPDKKTDKLREKRGF